MAIRGTPRRETRPLPGSYRQVFIAGLAGLVSDRLECANRSAINGYKYGRIVSALAANKTFQRAQPYMRIRPEATAEFIRCISVTVAIRRQSTCSTETAITKAH